jgi:uncharacterized protein (DUF58 family)
LRLRRCARGLGLLVILLFSCAFILDDMALLLAAGTLLAGLCGYYLHFDRRFRAVIGSLTVMRSMDRSLLRRGTTLRVATILTVTVPSRMQVTIAEMLPSGVALQDGVTAVTAEPSASPQTLHLAYRIMPVVHGTMHVAGISLSVKDILFAASIDCTAEQFSVPGFFVQPTGIFEPSSKRAMTETREIEKMSVISGLGIRALREYYAGDDMRSIDWKLSAKHDKLFVREYSGVVSLPPLILVDLPWRGAPYPAGDFDRMVAMVAGIVEYSIRTYLYVSVLIISGPNILHVMRDEKDLRHCISALREWMHPVERTVHFYRTPDRYDLRRQLHAVDTGLKKASADPEQRFLGSLRRQYQSALLNRKTFAFTGQLVRILSAVETDEIVVFSLLCGDTSHIRQVVRQAKTMKLRVHIRMPEIGDPAVRASYQSRLGADSVEAFA